MTAVADETFEAAAGTLVIIPRGLAHRWWNPRSEPTTFLNVHVPASGFESFVRELSELSADGRASPEAMTELGARYDVYFDDDVVRSRYPS